MSKNKPIQFSRVGKPSDRLVFADESGQTAHRHMVLGGVSCRREHVDMFEQELAELMHPPFRNEELGWKAINKARFLDVQRAVDWFFEKAQAGLIDFRCILIDTHELDHQRFNQGNKELGFAKFNMLLTAKFARVHCRTGDSVYVYLDQRETVHTPESLRGYANRHLSNKWGFEHAPVRRCAFIDSKASRLLQLGDILMGAVNFQSNNKDKTGGASIYKTQISAQVSRHLNNTRLNAELGAYGFEIWKFKATK